MYFTLSICCFTNFNSVINYVVAYNHLEYPLICEQKSKDSRIFKMIISNNIIDDTIKISETAYTQSKIHSTTYD